MGTAKLSPQDEAFIILLESGRMDASTAYKVVYRPNAQGSSINTLASRKRTSLKEYFTNTDELINSTPNVKVLGQDGEGGQIRNKDDIRSELNILIDAEKDSTRKAKLLLDLAALDGMKKIDGQEDTDQRVLYYLPIRCVSGCSLYAQAVKDGLINPDD